ncbi:MAG: cbb3-type cytochrome c oxidase subunit I, partial [Chloroflexi bacterium]|nr:cbb3-type cytochrome c oxidase subunit I [Chloroflexota bacterium]
TYFIVAHFHYTIVGGEVFAILAGIYYWFPKITGHTFDERLGKLHFFWVFVTYNVTFIPMFAVGLGGMNRRVADFSPHLTDLNLFISIAAFVMGAGFLVMVYNLAASWIGGPAAAPNPWRARSLEWQTSSPPPLVNFLTPPVVQGDPYDYGEPVSPGWRAGPAPIAGGAPVAHDKKGAI